MISCSPKNKMFCDINYLDFGTITSGSQMLKKQTFQTFLGMLVICFLGQENSSF